MSALRWGRHAYHWHSTPKTAGPCEWLCWCGDEVNVMWQMAFDLYDTDEPIGPEQPMWGRWRVECQGGHVLLTCRDLNNEADDWTGHPPTTALIAERLASAEDIAAWREFVAAKERQRATS